MARVEALLFRVLGFRAKGSGGLVKLRSLRTVLRPVLGSFMLANSQVDKSNGSLTVGIEILDVRPQP